MANFAFADTSSDRPKVVALPPGLILKGPPPGLVLEASRHESTDEEQLSKEAGTDCILKSSAPILAYDEVEGKAGLSSSDSDASTGSSSYEAHLKGECKPCAYFWAQADGCRRGNDCDFCHLYHPDAKKKKSKKWEWKKEKAKRQRSKTADAADQSGQMVNPIGGEKNLQDRGFEQGVPARVEIPTANEFAFYHRLAMEMPERYSMAHSPPLSAMPPVPPMPRKVRMPGLMPFPSMAAQRTPLSVQSRPYIPADLLDSCSKLMSTVAEEMGRQPMHETPMSIAMAAY